MLDTAKRQLNTASLRIARNPYQAIGAILVFVLAFFIGGLFVLITAGSSILLNYFESKPQVTAFFRDNTSAEEIEEIKKTLASTGYVATTRYISKEEALEIYREQNKKEPILLEFVTANILPASLEVSATEVKHLPVLADILSKETRVEDVIFQKDIIDTLTRWTTIIRNVGLGIVLFLILTSLFTTLIVIGLNIALHKDEIEIMRLVGATTWFIRVPFILEGIIYGTFSALISTIAIWVGVEYLSPILSSLFQGIPIFPVPPSTFILLLIGEVLLGAIIGTVGSLIATWRYLKV